MRRSFLGFDLEICCDWEGFEHCNTMNSSHSKRLVMFVTWHTLGILYGPAVALLGRALSLSILLECEGLPLS